MVRDRDPARPARRRGGRALAALILTATLGACASVSDGDAPPLSARIETLTSAEPTRHEHRVGQGAASVALTEWRPEGDAKAVILAVHGYGDYGPSTYAEAAAEWAERGIATYAYDQRGFGRNPSNADWPGHEALTDDLSRVSALIRQRHPGVPLTMVGHSMGGAVVAAALGEGRAQADGAVLLAPAFWGGPHLSPVLRAMAWSAARISPDKRWTGEGVVRIQASDNVEMLRALGRDPLYVRAPSSREFLGLIRLMDRAWAAAPALALPVLTLYGANDQVIPERPVREAHARMPGALPFGDVPEGWHMLLRDLKAEAPRRAVADFALSRGGEG